MALEPPATRRRVNSLEAALEQPSSALLEPIEAIGSVLRCLPQSVAHILPLLLFWQTMNHRSQDGDDDADQRRSAALIGLIIIRALAMAVVWRGRDLREKYASEECLVSWLPNRAPVESLSPW